jgi:outer membrane usher protein
MKSLTLLLLHRLALMFVSQPGLMTPNTVNFNVTGKIEEPVCEVSVKPSSAIDLGTVSYQI